jgi:hypothetical protein
MPGWSSSSNRLEPGRRGDIRTFKDESNIGDEAVSGVEFVIEFFH